CSTRSSSGRGYMCDSESDSERVSTLCPFLPRRFTDFADNLRRTQGLVPGQLNPYTGGSVAAHSRRPNNPMTSKLDEIANRVGGSLTLDRFTVVAWEDRSRNGIWRSRSPRDGLE
ncbi:hypothetical protein HPB47_023333, partial [Ixodes persulcatus]